MQFEQAVSNQLCDISQTLRRIETGKSEVLSITTSNDGWTVAKIGNIATYFKTVNLEQVPIEGPLQKIDLSLPSFRLIRIHIKTFGTYGSYSRNYNFSVYSGFSVYNTVILSIAETNVTNSVFNFGDEYIFPNNSVLTMTITSLGLAFDGIDADIYITIEEL